MESQTKELIKILHENNAHSKPGHFRTNYSGGVKQYDAKVKDDLFSLMKKMRAHILGLSDKDFKILMSDSYWIKYPAYKYDSVYYYYENGQIKIRTHTLEEASSARIYGHIIRGFIFFLADFDYKLLKKIAKVSDGILLLNCIQQLLMEDRYLISKKALNSKDIRVKNAAIRRASLKSIKFLLEDPSIKIRNTVVNRLGFYKYYKHIFKNEKINSRASVELIRVAKLDEIDYEEILNAYKEKYNATNGHSWKLVSMANKVVEVLKKASDEYLLMNLDLAHHDKSAVGDYISYRIKLINGD